MVSNTAMAKYIIFRLIGVMMMIAIYMMMMTRLSIAIQRYMAAANYFVLLSCSTVLWRSLG